MPLLFGEAVIAGSSPPPRDDAPRRRLTPNTAYGCKPLPWYTFPCAEAAARAQSSATRLRYVFCVWRSAYHGGILCLLLLRSMPMHCVDKTTWTAIAEICGKNIEVRVDYILIIHGHRAIDDVAAKKSQIALSNWSPNISMREAIRTMAFPSSVTTTILKPLRFSRSSRSTRSIAPLLDFTPSTAATTASSSIMVYRLASIPRATRVFTTASRFV